MKADPPPLPQPRPWYYQTWVLVPAFVLGWPVPYIPLILWPLWAVLIIRSPWHAGILFRALAWAMLLTGGVMQVWWVSQSGSPAANVVALILPGLLLAALTQFLWLRDKSRLLLAEDRPSPSAESAKALAEGAVLKSHPGVRRRKVRSRPGYRRGRRSRHPM